MRHPGFSQVVKGVNSLTTLIDPDPKIQYIKFCLNRTGGSEITAVYNFDLENSGSRSHRRSQVMTYICVHRSNDSFGVSFVSIGPSDLELRPFETLTLKFRGQGHVECQRSWPTFMVLEPTIHLALVSSQSDRRFWNYSYLKLWPWDFGVKVAPEVKGHDLHLWTSSQRIIWRWFRLDRADGSGITAVFNFDLDF